MNKSADAAYWADRYAEGQTGWDIGYASPPIRDYLDQLEDKNLRILIPGAGNAHEAAYAWQQGFRNVFILDIAAAPLQGFQQRVPDFPEKQLIQGDFFTHQGEYDLVLEQTFFCSFPPDPDQRNAYARRMYELLSPGGKLVGLWFQFPLREGQTEPPYGGSREEYLHYFSPLFEVKTLTTAPNSIRPRAGNELFGIFVRP
jgi:SAM-dependent methyltransferase